MSTSGLPTLLVNFVQRSKGIIYRRNQVVALGWSLQHHGKQLPGLL
jgi:hypothetical protein